MDPIGLVIMGVMALTGGIINSVDQANSDVRTVKDALAQVKEYERQRDQKLKDLDLEFEIADKEAKKQANRQDKELTLNELFTSDSLNGQFDALRLGQEQNALKWNLQAMQNDMDTGDALSTMAASGTRTNSMSDAVEMQASMNSQLLQLEQDQTRAQNKIQLANLFGGLNESVNKIGLGREDAMDLRTSYDEGGNQWRLYQNDRGNIKADYKAAIDDLQGDVNEYMKPKNAFLRGIKAFFGGASQGWQFGANAADYVSKWKQPGTNSFKGANDIKTTSTNMSKAAKSWNNIG